MNRLLIVIFFIGLIIANAYAANCNMNEVYDECPAKCPPKRCNVDISIVFCAAQPLLGAPECEPGCRCKDNYYRNDKNQCVPRNQCPPIIGIPVTNT